MDSLLLELALRPVIDGYKREIKQLKEENEFLKKQNLELIKGLNSKIIQLNK